MNETRSDHERPRTRTRASSGNRLAAGSGRWSRRRPSGAGTIVLPGCATGSRVHSARCPRSPCPLEPEVLGTLLRDGYAIERLTFQSRPGVRVTANLYRPEPVRGAVSGGRVGSWALGLGPDGPACPTSVHRTGEARLRGALPGCVWGRRTSDRARAGNVPRSARGRVALAGGHAPPGLAGL